MKAAKRRSPTALLLGPALLLAGCWTAPIATVQPPGEARLVQHGIIVESEKPVAIVESVDRSAAAIVLRPLGASAASTYKVGREVENLDELRMGDRVKPTIREELTIYVLRDGAAPGPDGAPVSITADARVLSVDASYRLLRLQYPDGEERTLKVALGVDMRHLEAGNAVVIRPIEAIALREKR
jgi:hypothetical protein